MLETETHNPRFFGREDVFPQISQALLPSNTKFVSSESESLRKFAICGLGGMGKTEIAIEFALRNKDAFDAIFWISAAESTKLDARYSQIAVRLGLETQLESTNHVVSRELVKGWLSKPWKRVMLEGNRPAVEEAKWLLIFDNADDAYVLTDYWPIQGSGSVLITSRDPLMKSLFSTAPSGLDLEPMSDRDGGALLRNLAQDEDKEGLSEKIANMLGGLPLAIVQMTGIIRRQALRLSEFMESYNDHSEHSTLYQLKSPLGPQAYPHTISTVWALESLTPGAKHFLYVLAFLDPDCIQEYILTDVNADFAEWFPTKPTTFREARTELIQASLVKRNKDMEELTVHRLVQDVVRSNMTIAITKETFWFVVGLLVAQWPTAFSPATTRDAQVKTPQLHFIERWPRCAALYPHVFRLKNLHEVLGRGVLGEPKLSFAALLADAAWYFFPLFRIIIQVYQQSDRYQFEQGRSQGFDGFWEIALPICEQSSETGKDSLLIDINFCLGAIESETNQHDAARKHKARALELQLATRKALDVVDIRLARCYSEDAIAKIQAGDYDAAVEHLLARLEIDKSLGVYPYNWIAEANLGLAYILQGKLSDADEILSGTLERRETKFGYMDNKDYR